MTEQQLSHYDAADRNEDTADVWRSEVQNRLERYKRRRGRRIEGAYTMRFPFPVEEEVVVERPIESALPAPPQEEFASEAVPEPELALPASTVDTVEVDDAQELTALAIEEPAPSVEETNNLVLQPPPVFEEEDVTFVDPVVRPRPKRKVIAFPKHLSVAPEVVHRLADPVTNDAPRILDVPEELEAIPSTPFLEGLRLDVPNPAEQAARLEHVDLPCQPVKTSQRVLAGLVDLGITGAAAAVFGAVAYFALSRPPISKFLILGLSASAVVLWTVYQYLFLVYAGKTIGMLAARIRLRTFKGKAPNAQRRRRRVFGLYLSSLSLGMGLMWVFVDVDSLCWHDRLSRTYMARKD
jgi:uncharacterized RDD family membrane protein YckC